MTFFLVSRFLGEKKKKREKRERREEREERERERREEMAAIRSLGILGVRAASACSSASSALTSGAPALTSREILLAEPWWLGGARQYASRKGKKERLGLDKEKKKKDAEKGREEEPRIPATSTTGNPDLDELLGLELYKIGVRDYTEQQFKRAHGRPWEAKELRLKSFEDLHKLWYVLLKERNFLVSEKHRFAAKGLLMPQHDRIAKVKVSMARIKTVLRERALAIEDEESRRQENDKIDAK